jgi:gliding motility-associated lipoprotein GldH
MKAKIIAMLAILFTLNSCDKSKVYSGFDKDFPDNRWMKSDVRIYNFSIEEKGRYVIDFDFSHIYDYQFETVPITTDLLFPAGIHAFNKVNLQIKSDGKEVGDCSGDYCDLSATIYPAHTYEPGKYSLKVSHRFQGEYLPNVLGIGITVKRTGEK